MCIRDSAKTDGMIVHWWQNKAPSTQLTSNNNYAFYGWGDGWKFKKVCNNVRGRSGLEAVRSLYQTHGPSNLPGGSPTISSPTVAPSYPTGQFYYGGSSFVNGTTVRNPSTGAITSMPFNLDVSTGLNVSPVNGEDTTDGNWTFYYKTGQQWQEGSWKDGIPTGEHVKWYPNGNTKTILTYVDGGLEGPITKWFEDGQVKEEAFYYAGKLDSSYSSWYSNGSKKEEGDYFRGIQNGHWTFWHENGELKRDGSYSDGEMDGIWVEYAADGNSIQRSRYDEGLFLYDLHWGPKELYTRAQKLRKKNIESSVLVLDNIVNSFKESKYATRSQFLKAEIYMNDLKDYNAAIREYKAVVKLFPTSAQAQDSQYMVSYIYGSVLENRKQAKKEYKTFLKKYPSSRLVSAVRLELKQLNSRMARK